MKKTLFLLIVATAATCRLAASDRIIIKPESLYQNLLFRLRTDTVSLSDTATVFSMHVSRDEEVFFLSSETCLRDMKKRSYPLRHIISDYGFRPDEPRTFDAIGKNNFDIKLVFPPLPVDAKEVDLIDPQYYSHGIFGIRLDGTPLPPFKLPDGVEERLKDVMAVQDTLPSVEYRFGWATIKGQLLEYKPGMCDQITLVSARPGSLPHAHDDTLSVQVSPTGSFTFQLPVAHVTLVSLTFEPSQQSVRGIVYVGPDAETEVYFNMREINHRLITGRHGSNTILYVTKGPLAQLANELNQHLHFYRLDFNHPEEWNRYKEIQSMMPTKQLEVRVADLDTMKTDEQWSPAMKELVGLFWRMNEFLLLHMSPPQGLEEEARESAEAQQRLIAWQRDAVVAELDSYERLISNPKTLYCPDLSYLLSAINYSALLPDYIFYEKTVHKMRREMDWYFNLLDPDEVADNQANLPLAYKQLVQAWQNIYRREREQLAVKEIVGDTLKDVSYSVVFQTLCNRYQGHTVFIRFWRNYNPDFINHVVLPLQRELADLDIVWVNVFNSSLDVRSKYAGWDPVTRLRYFTKLQGEHYYYEQSGRSDQISALNKTMGIEGTKEAYVIVSPDGRIVRNSSTPPSPVRWMESQDYLGIRQCLRKTACSLE